MGKLRTLKYFSNAKITKHEMQKMILHADVEELFQLRQQKGNPSAPADDMCSWDRIFRLEKLYGKIKGVRYESGMVIEKVVKVKFDRKENWRTVENVQKAMIQLETICAFTELCSKTPRN